MDARPLDLDVAFGKPLDPQFRSILCGLFEPALAGADAGALVMDDGSTVPVVRSIPRFAPSDLYASSFSFQWSIYTTTQVDSVQGVDLTEKDLISKTGLTHEQVAGKLVLDAGVGVGRHAEVLARWGAYVVGVDLSTAVEAARDNLFGYDRAVVLQADIGRLPFRPGSFDFVVSIGVLHHTPDTRSHAQKLVPLLKPGGELAIWVYPPSYNRRGEWIPMTSRLPLAGFDEWCRWIVGVARANRGNPWLEAFVRQFPFSTHHPTVERSVLALFDGYTPAYHWTHTVEEVSRWFLEFGLEAVRANPIPTAVRGRRPAQTASPPCNV